MKIKNRIEQFLEDSLRGSKTDLLARVKFCQSALTKADAGFHQELYQVLAAIYEISYAFRDDKVAWKLFLQEKFWKKCNQKKPPTNPGLNEIILWVSRFVFRAADTRSPRYNRAYKHARTLQGYARQNVPQAAVAERLAGEGADYAFRAEVEEQPRRAKSSSSGISAHVRGQASRTSGSGRSGKSIAPSERVSESGNPILEVEIADRGLERVLSLSIGQKAKIVVQRRGRPRGMEAHCQHQGGSATPDAEQAGAGAYELRLICNQLFEPLMPEMIARLAAETLNRMSDAASIPTRKSHSRKHRLYIRCNTMLNIDLMRCSLFK
jgi:hypothetical protein